MNISNAHINTHTQMHMQVDMTYSEILERKKALAICMRLWHKLGISEKKWENRLFRYCDVQKCKYLVEFEIGW